MKLKLKKRYHKGTFDFFSRELIFTDAPSTVSTYEEIFIKEIYNFETQKESPYIIDCGANIGLSCIYFMKKFPNARILAFEADSDIFKILSSNVSNHGGKDVELVNKAVWDKESNISFVKQGGLSGYISDTIGSENFVVTTSLRPFLNEPVDLLKIDIEGAEYDVLCDIKDNLNLVDKLFVEYHSYFDKEQKLNEILTIVSKAGFRYYIQEASPTLNPFIALNKVDNMDLQLNIFCFR